MCINTHQCSCLGTYHILKNAMHGFLEKPFWPTKLAGLSSQLSEAEELMRVPLTGVNPRNQALEGQVPELTNEPRIVTVNNDKFKSGS